MNPATKVGTNATPVAERDPLGLTDYQRAVSDACELFATMRKNFEATDALPAGTMIKCHLPGCGPHPIEMYR